MIKSTLLQKEHFQQDILVARVVKNDYARRGRALGGLQNIVLPWLTHSEKEMTFAGVK